MKRKSSFALRLTIPIVICTIAIFVASIMIVGSVVNRILTEQAIEKSQSALKTASLYVNTSLEEVQNVIENNAWLVKENKDDTSVFPEITAKVLRDNSAIIGSSISLNPYYYKGLKYSGYSCYTGTPRRISYSYLYTDAYDYTSMDWYQIPLLLEKPVWSEVYYDDGGGNQRMTTYSYPMIDDEGKVFAIFTADISLDWLTDKAVSIKPYDESVNLVISRGGKILTGDNNEGETIFSYALENADSLLLKSGKRMIAGATDFIEFEFKGRDVIAIFGPLENGWSMMLLSYYSDVVAPIITINIILISMLLVAIAVIVIISNRIVKKHTRPLNQFAEVVRNIGNGFFENKLPEIKTNDEIKTLRDALDQMQTHRKDLDDAKVIYSSIVPAPSLVTDFADLYVQLEPARFVGGDLYDYYDSTRRHKLFFLVGDVAGKGVPAALFMSTVISSARLITKYSDSESEIVKVVNDNISTNNSMGMFVTYLFGSIDKLSRKLVICNAGHNHPILVTPDGKAKYLDLKANLVGGAMDGFEYSCDEFYLQEGSRLILYTDGVTEAERPDLEQYGEERLLNLVSSIPFGIGSEEAVKLLKEDIRAFAEYRKYAPEGVEPHEGYPQNDDITMMIITLNKLK